jgi:hypothetical protein
MDGVLASQRRDVILEEVRRTGAVQASDLVLRLGGFGHDRAPGPRRARPPWPLSDDARKVLADNVPELVIAEVNEAVRERAR